MSTGLTDRPPQRRPSRVGSGNAEPARGNDSTLEIESRLRRLRRMSCIQVQIKKNVVVRLQASGVA